MASSVIIPALISAAPGLIKAGVEVARDVRQNRKDKGKERPAPRRLQQRGPLSEQRRSTRSPIPDFDAQQIAAIRAIAAETTVAPLPPELARARSALVLALIVNAWKESRLRPRAHNPRGEDSVGLFQVNRRAHPGHSREDLKDPRYNTRVFLGILARQRRRFEPVLTGATVAELTGLVTYWGERPRRRLEASIERAELAQEWLGPLADVAALGWRIP